MNLTLLDKQKKRRWIQLIPLWISGTLFTDKQFQLFDKKTMKIRTMMMRLSDFSSVSNCRVFGGPEIESFTVYREKSNNNNNKWTLFIYFISTFLCFLIWFFISLNLIISATLKKILNKIIRKLAGQNNFVDCWGKWCAGPRQEIWVSVGEKIVRGAFYWSYRQFIGKIVGSRRGDPVT